MTFKILLLFFFISFLSVSIAQDPCRLPVNVPTKDIFIKEQGAGFGDGSSWDNAMDGRLLAKYLRDTANDSTVLRIAEGIYYPYFVGCDNSATQRQYSFNISKNSSMYGGYPNTLAGTDTSLRNPAQHITRLSGEIQQDSNLSNNSFHVVIITINASPIIDGFHISAGYADDGGAYLEGTQERDIPDAGNGGGILNQGGSSAIVLLQNLVVENNTAYFGSGIYFKSNLATIIKNVVVRNNHGLINYGGAGIFAWGNFRFINSTIHNNTNGSGIVSWGGDMAIWNSTIAENDRFGISVLPVSGASIFMGIISSTIANNQREGLLMENKTSNPDNIQLVNMENSLLINNSNGSNEEASNMNNSGIVDGKVLKKNYSIIGNQFYDGQEPIGNNSSVPTLVTIGPLTNNGGFSPTYALLHLCVNPAVNTGSPALLNRENDGLNIDQRGVQRNSPNPCIGAFDSVFTTQLQVHPAGSFESCIGSDIQISVTAIASTGSFITSYQWQKNDTVIEGATDSILSINSVSLNDSGNYDVVVVTNATCVDTSDTITLIPRPLPTAIITGDTSICAGTSAVLHITFTGTAPWTVNYTDGINNYTDSNITVSNYNVNVTPVNATSYTITSVSDAGCSNTGGTSTTINVISHALLQTSITNNTPCVGDNVQISVTAIASTGSFITSYQWQKNDTVIEGATDSILSINSVSLNDSGNYDVVVVTNATCVDTSDTITLIPRPLPTAIITGDTSICAGTSAVLHITFTGTAPWTVNYTDGINNYTDSNITVSNYNLNVTPVNATSYTITSVSDAGCSNTGGTSTTINVISHALLQTSITNNTPCVGDNVQISVTAIASTGSFITSYQWQKNDTVIEGATDSILSINSVSLNDSGNYDVVVVTNATCVDTSDTITLIPRPLPTAIITGDTSICAGTSAVLHITFTGTAPWTVNYTDGINNYTDSNITVSNYNVNVTPVNATSYTITSVSDAGCSNTGGTSTTINVISHALLQTSITNNTPCVGDNVQISVTAIASTGSFITSYQWQKNDTVIEGATDSILSINSVSLNDSGNYDVVVVTNATCVDTSDTITLIPRPLPTAIITGDTSICAGTSAVLHITFTGTAPWTVNYTDGINNYTDSNITVSNYNLNVTPVNATSYTITSVSDAGCSNTGGTSTTINVISHALLQTSITNNTPCVGDNVQISVTAIASTGSFITSYQWQKNDTVIEGATDSILSINSVSLNDSGNYDVVVVTNATCVDTSDTITLIPRPLPTAIITGDTSICAGTSAVLHITFTGTAPWTVNYTDGINNYTDSNITVSNYNLNVTPVNATSYTITSVSDAGCSNTGGTSTTINVISHALLQTSITNNTPCVGDNVQISVTAIASTGSFITSYQWQKNDTVIEGATDSILSINSVSLNDSGNYDVVVVTNATCVDTSDTITLIPRPLPTAIITGDTSICAGTSAVLHITFTGTAPWTVNYTDGINNYTDSNITVSNYNVNVTPVNATSYTITSVSDAGCSNTGGTSTTINVISHALLQTSITNNTPCVGDNVQISVTAIASTGSFITSYQWQKNDTVIEGATDSILSINSVSLNDSGNYDVVVVTNATCVDTSDTITLIPRPLPTAIITGDTSICAGTSAVLHITFTGTAPWTVNYTDGINNYTDSNITVSNYNLNVTPVNATSYTITSVSDAGCSNTGGTSTTINVISHALLQTSITNNTPCVGDNVQISVTAIASTGSFITSYQWQKNDTVIEGATDSILSINSVSLNDSGNYDVVVVTNATCVDTSDTITLIPRPLPTAIITGDTSICAGTSAVLHITFTGTAPWTVNYTDGINNYTDSNITVSNYNVNVTPVNATSYTITSVSDAGCSNTGGTSTTINVISHALLQTSITNNTPCVGDNVQISVTAIASTGSFITSYQWQKNDTVIEGATDSILSINSVSLNDSGNYDVVVVTNATCVDTSDTITLIPRPLPTAIITGDTSICAGTSAVLHITFTGTAPWTVNYTDGINNYTDSNITVSNYNLNVTPVNATSYTITSVSDAGCSNTGGTSTTINVISHALLQTSITNNTPCVGDNVQISVTAIASTGSFITSYQWQKNDTVIEGATDSILSINSVSLNDSGNYDVVVVTNATCVDTSDTITLIPRPLPTAIITGDTSICAGTSAVLHITFTGTAPWTVNYTDGINNYTDSNITASNYNVNVTPVNATSYTITSVSDAGCSNTGGTSTTINVISHALLQTSITNNTPCVGDNVQISVTAIASTGSFITSYQWQKNDTVIEGATDSILSINSVSLNDSGNYDVVVVTNATCVDTSDTITLIPRPLPTAIITGDTSICAGTSAVLHITFTGTAPWTVNYTDGINNYTDSNITVSNYNVNVTPVNATSYTITSVSDAGCSNTGGTSTTINVISHALLQTSITNNTPCVGDNVQISVTAIASTGSFITSYQWQKNDTVIEGATDSILSINSVSLNDSGNYDVVVVTNATCVDTSDTITLIPRPLPTAIITGDTSICAGTSAVLHITFTGTAPWTVNYTDGINNYTDSNITVSNYNLNVTPVNATSYTITSVSDAGCSNTGGTSTTINVISHALLQTSITNNTPCVGDNVQISVTAIASTGSFITSYQWQKNDTVIEGATDSILSINSVSLNDSGNYDVVVVTNATCVDTSDTITLIPRPLPTAIITGDTSICAGTSAVLHITFTGTAPWTVNYTGGINNYTDSNIMVSNYNVNVTPVNATSYTITSVSDAGCSNTGGTSTTINVISHALLQTSITNNTPCVGDNVQISVTAIASTGSFITSYQWQKNDTVIEGATDSILSINSVSLNDSGNYDVVVVTNATCVDTSDTITLIPRPLPTAIITGDTSICAGTSAVLHITFTGTAPWTVNYTDGINNYTDSNITVSNYNVNVTPVNATSYTITSVSDAGCSNTGGTSTTINVISHALLQTSITNNTPCVGDNVQISVTAIASTGSFITSYQWQKNDTVIEGATDSILSINSVSLNDSGNYDVVVVTNATCVDTSDTITLIPRPLPTAIITGDTSICAGTSAVLHITFTGTAPWTVNYTDGINNYTDSNITVSNYNVNVTPVNATSYTITSVSDAGCSNTGGTSTTINVISHALLQTSITNNTPCVGDNVQISVTAIASTGSFITSYQWQKNDTVIEGATDSILSINSVSLNDSGNYDVVVVTNATCVDTSDTITLIPRPLPTAIITGDTSICAGTSAVLHITFTGTAPWTVNYTDGINNYTDSNITVSNYNVNVTPVNATSYTITSVSDAGCSNTGGTSVTVSVLPIPVATVVPDSLNINSDSTTNIVISSIPSDASFIWTAQVISGNVSGAIFGTGNHISQVLTGNGIVEYTVIPQLNGCTGKSVTALVKVSETNANLKNLFVNDIPVNNFSPSITQYTDSVAYAIDTVSITGIPEDSTATVTDISNMQLNVGDNHFIITVIASNGVTKKEYSVNVVRLSNNDTLQGITINGRLVAIASNSNTITTQLLCGETSAKIIAIAPLNGHVTINNVPDSLTLATPAPGVYPINITVTAQDSNFTQSYILNTIRPFDANILFQPYNTQIEVISNPVNNGGFTFTKYQWYKNGIAIQNETKAYLHETDGMDSTALYSAELTTTTGITAFTCAKKAVIQRGFDIKIFPNPINSGDNLTIDIIRDPGQNANIDINLIDMTGKAVFNKKNTGNLTIFKVPALPAGVYILQLYSPFLGKKSFSIVIL